MMEFGLDSTIERQNSFVNSVVRFTINESSRNLNNSILHAFIITSSGVIQHMNIIMLILTIKANLLA